jgi:hypothetical protein
MNQYYQILSSCRLPGTKQDSVVNFIKAKKPPMHITVVHNYQVGALTPLRGLAASTARSPLGRFPSSLPLPRPDSIPSAGPRRPLL